MNAINLEKLKVGQRKPTKVVTSKIYGNLNIISIKEVRK